MEHIRILIADDHPLFRDGLRALLHSVDDTEVIGEAASGDAAVELAAQLQPDVILMDLKMPGLNGIEATRRIHATSPHIRILIITMYEEDESIFAAMRAGALGYQLKGAEQAEILRGIRAVANGEMIFSPVIAIRVIHYLESRASAPHSQIFPELTARELEILNLIAQGCNNTEIAERLVLSPKTVRNHVSNIFSKMQVADRAEAIIRARKAGLGSDE